MTNFRLYNLKSDAYCSTHNDVINYDVAEKQLESRPLGTAQPLGTLSEAHCLSYPYRILIILSHCEGGWLMWGDTHMQYKCVGEHCTSLLDPSKDHIVFPMYKDEKQSQGFNIHRIMSHQSKIIYLLAGTPNHIVSFFIPSKSPGANVFFIGILETTRKNTSFLQISML